MGINPTGFMWIESMSYKNNLKELEKIILKVMADDPEDNPDQQNQDSSQQTDDSDDQSTMQVLTTGTAQQLCMRLWKGFITQDETNFPAFMQQIDQICTQFQQALPVPVDPDDLEDEVYDPNGDNLPSLGAPEDYQ